MFSLPRGGFGKRRRPGRFGIPATFLCTVIWTTDGRTKSATAS